MNGLIRTLPVSAASVMAPVAENSGSVLGERAPRMTPDTAAVVFSRWWPEESTRTNDPVSTRPPLWLGWVAVTGMPVPVTDRPTSVATALLSAMVDVPADAVAPASVRGPGTWLPPPSRQVPAG